MSTFVLKLSRFFGATIGTRQAVDFVEQKLPATAGRIVLDFSHIEFISRSFAHELLLFQERSARPIAFSHLSVGVELILDLVRAHRKQGRSKGKEEEITDSSVRLSDIAAQF